VDYVGDVVVIEPELALGIVFQHEREMYVPLVVRLQQVDDPRLFRLVHNPIQHPEKWENMAQSCGVWLADPKLDCVSKYSLFMGRKAKGSQHEHVQLIGEKCIATKRHTSALRGPGILARCRE
jgi:hypothetical protein